jgi:hypothetical protein
MVQIIERQPTTSDRFMQAVGVAAGAGAQGMVKEHQKMAQRKLMEQENSAAKRMGIDLMGITDPDMRKAVVQEALKGKSESRKLGDELSRNRTILRDLEEKRGLEPESLSAYESDVKMAEQISRPAKEPKKTQASQPIDPEQLNIIKNIRNSDAYKQASPLQKYQLMTDNGVSKENAQVEADISGKEVELTEKKIDSGYKLNEEFINKTTGSYQAWEMDTKPRLNQMMSLEDQDLATPATAFLTEKLGLPLSLMANPTSELYEKVSQDLLKGLPETYGSRILQVEVQNFLKTIPRLLNSADGRRMIVSNMLKLGEMKEALYKNMRNAEKSYSSHDKPLPKDFQREVLDTTMPQLAQLQGEFSQLSQITEVPQGTIPMFSPQGTIKFVPKNEKQQWVDKGGRPVW